MTVSPKKNLSIPCLSSINEILSEYDFLEYSTQKRNLAYLIQYVEFKVNILREYNIYGSVRASLLRGLIINIANIIEYLLYTSLRTSYSQELKSCKFPSLVGQARLSGLISRQLAGDLNKINTLRSHLHPSRQKQKLDHESFDQRKAKRCLLAMHNLRDELKTYFKNKDIYVETKEVKCPYEGYSHVLFRDNICPCCGELHY